jgi:RNA polymerase sigma-70 factor (ECF subfamily)
MAQIGHAFEGVIVGGALPGFTGLMASLPPPETGVDIGPDRTDLLADLLEAIAERRDRESFAQLFDHFAPRLKGFFWKGGASAAQAEDLMQDVMLSLWQRAGQFDRRKAAASTWVYAIARNRRIDVLRRERRPEIDPDDPALVPDAEPLPDARLVTGQVNRRLADAVARLPEEQAFLLRLSFFEDKPHSVIAAETDLPLGTVKSRLRLALTKLKTAMKEIDDADASS